MAKRAKASTIAEDTAPKKSPEEVFKEQWPIIVAAKLEQEEAATAQTAANQAYRATLKTAKKLGIDTDAVVRVLALRDLDPNDVSKSFANINSYLEWIGLPVGFQLGLSLDGRDIASKVDEAKLREAGVVKDGAPDDDFDKPHMTSEAMVQKAKTDGFNAGSSNKPLLANPFPAESPEGLAWAGSWKDAQTAIVQRMGRKGRSAGEAQPQA